MSNVSFLLGAGFSVPAGYPTAYDVSQKLLAYDSRYIYAAMDGLYHIRKELFEVDEQFFQREYDRMGWNGESADWKEGALMLEVMIECYRQDIDALLSNYESLYDFIMDFRSEEVSVIDRTLAVAKQIGASERKVLDRYWQSWLGNFENYKNTNTGRSQWYNAIRHSVLCFDFLINSIINNLKNGNSFAYNNLVSFVNEISDGKIFFHTLNHDTLLESIMSDNSLPCDDGFEVGNYYSHESPIMACFSGKYTERIRLYKLHGSVNYWNYYYVINGRGTNTNVVAKHNGIDAHSHYIYDKDKAQIMAENSALILSGASTKIKRYNGPLVSELIPLFKDNIRSSDLVIVVGYGFMDSIINEIIDVNVLQDETKNVIVVGWGNEPDFLVSRGLPNERVKFHPEGIAAYDFIDATELLRS